MGELNTSRPFQERFLDNFDRSALRREVEAVKPRKKTLFSGLRKKYATYALGASLALGGIGAPLKMIQYSRGGDAKGPQPAAATVPIDGQLAGDIEAAQSIARQVAGGVTGGVQAAVSGAVEGVETAASVPLRVATAAPQTLKLVSEEVRQDFFHKEVPFGSIIYREAKRNNLRPELVAAVVQAESKFQPAARSGAGAIGLMQLVPRTGRWMGAQDLHNPAQNISAGAKYLKYLHDRFDGNETAVIAAYNAGEGNVKRFNGVPPFRETRNYVRKVRGFEDDFRSRVQNRVVEAGSAPIEADAR